MNIHYKSYPMTTSKINPDEPRKLVTLFEHFRADPRGAASYPEWLNNRELLQKQARLEFRARNGTWTRYSFAKTVAECMTEHSEAEPWFLPSRLILLDGTIIKEWLPETKESANVEQT